jgi:hypothetical protein
VTKRVDEILREMHDAYFKDAGRHKDPSAFCPFVNDLRPFAERLARAESEPQAIDLVKKLRAALGLALVTTDSSQALWEETLDAARRMRSQANAYVMRAQITAEGLVPTRTAEVDALLEKQIVAPQAGEEAWKREVDRKIERLERAIAEIDEQGLPLRTVAVGEIVREVGQR